MKRTATAHWQGSGKEGSGTLNAPSGVLSNTAYSYRTRFEEGVLGTNPEELIAAAHAGCFSMKLSFVLGAAGFTPDSIETTAHLTFEGGVISKIHLETRVKAPGIGEEQFAVCAQDAKENCPVSKLLNAEITLEAKLQ